MRMFTVVATAAAIVVLTSSALAQLVNTGFEDWSGGEPTTWATSNNILVTNVTQTLDAHSGSYAVHGVVVPLPYLGTTLEPTLQNGNAEGVAYTTRPATFSCWYKFAPVTGSGDRFGINVGLFKTSVDVGDGFAVAAAAISTPASTWTKVTVPFVFQTNDYPSVLVVSFLIVGPAVGVYPTVGSAFDIDDISVEGTTPTAVAGEKGIPQKFALEQNYPNPFNPSTEISYQLAEHSTVKLAVYDLLGREVAELVNGVEQAGPHTVRFNGQSLSSGAYLCRLEAGGKTAVRRMILMK